MSHHHIHTHTSKRNIFVISGPSGSGKSTLIKRLTKEHEDIIFSVSHTTRTQRDGEKEGQDYYFINEDDFRAMAEKGEFAEWAQVYQNFYGTSLKEIDEKSCGECNLVLDIDVQGAARIKEKFPQAIMVLVVPPNLEELKKRLVAREKVHDNNIENRLAAAGKELRQYRNYDYIVVNGQLETAYAALKAIYRAFNFSTVKQQEFVESLLASINHENFSG